MIHDLQLPVCPPLGPVEDDGHPTEIPNEWNGDPLTLLPDPYVLNAKEAELATRYRNEFMGRVHGAIHLLLTVL